MLTKDLKIAYNQGKKAKEDGWERHSPYHNCKAEIYWLLGFDGLEISR